MSSILPASITELYPNYLQLKWGYEWYLDASEAKKESYRAARLWIAQTYSPITEFSTDLMTSGTLGQPKHYKWGPHHTEMTKFYLDFVRSGTCLNKTAVLEFRAFEPWLGTPNSILAIERGSNVYDCYVLCGISGQGPIAGLAAALAGHDVIICPSHFRILQDYADILDAIDPEAVVAFTSEILPPDQEQLVLASGRRCRDFMRCWDGGATFYTCVHGRRHWLDYLALTWLDGLKLYSSDYYNLAQPHLDYFNGDELVMIQQPCPCGLPAFDLVFKDRISQIILKSHEPGLEWITYYRLLGYLRDVLGRMGIQPHPPVEAVFAVSVERGVIAITLLTAGITLNPEQRRAVSEQFLTIGFEAVQFDRAVKPDGRKLKRFVEL